MKKYLVIGNPINHSLSPKLHNYWLEQNNINAVYDKMKLEENEIETIIQDIKKQKIAGCNVTVPFKKIVIPFLDKLSLEAEQTQSVNTILFNNGDVIGHNTDIEGFYKAIATLKFPLKNKKVLIIGAGGVVPSIIFALKKMHVSEISITNRTEKKAEDIKNQFNNIILTKWGDLPEFDMVINATSLGLNNESIKLNFSKVGKNKLFYDVIYNPEKTNFLEEAKKNNNRTTNGKMMFLYQAQASFKIWTGVEPVITEEVIKTLND